MDDDDNIYYYETIPSNGIVYGKIGPQEMEEEGITIKEEELPVHQLDPLLLEDDTFTQKGEKRSSLHHLWQDGTQYTQTYENPQKG